jgi:DNA phosphorothioation-associated DGQHR protein 1
MENNQNYLELPALKINQPLGVFYVISISAKDLLSVSFSEPLKYIDNSGKVKGNQRPKDEKRLKEIAKYIDSVEMAFPNSIILTANYTENGKISKDHTERWKVTEKGDICQLIIPKNIKLAAIIDGQHRLSAFEYVTNQERFEDLQLLCSVYFDLPSSYQAFLFATINSNQKKVDRSLALEQFGYNVDEESEKAWTPEKLAVFLSRKLNIDSAISPFYNHIKVAPMGVENLFDGNQQKEWVVSTATIVDGICSLITSNAKRDRILMQQQSIFSGRSRSLVKEIKDVSPLRIKFLELQDQTLYDVIVSYFDKLKNTLWNNASQKSYINKTVGIQASFDILKLIITTENSDLPEEIEFGRYLEKMRHIDFSDKFFQASGIGRSRIKNVMAVAGGILSKEKLKKNDLKFYEEILEGKNTKLIKEKHLWEEEAENAVLSTLQNVEWNFDNTSVSLYLNEDYDFENVTTYYNFQEFFNKLVEIAEVAFASTLPSDIDELKEKFDAEDLVYSYLSNYDENLKKLGWITAYQNYY